MKKIPTLYVREFDDEHGVKDVKNEINPVLGDIDLDDLVPTVKYDGACCAFIDGVFYKRYDAKNGKPVPEGAIKCQDEPDPITKHLPCWVKVTDRPADKWFNLANSCSPNLIRDGTFEAIGMHFNGNPYCVNYDRLVPHGQDVIEDLDKSFEGIRQYLFDHYIEGIVFWYENKPLCKIKRSDFGYPWGSSK